MGGHMSNQSGEQPWYQDIGGFIDKVNCGLAARDRDMKIVYINDRLLGWLGYERSEILGQESGALFPAKIRDLLLLEKEEIEGGDLRARLTVCLRKDGTGFPVLVLPQPLRDDTGEVIGGVSVVVDLTLRRRRNRACFTGANCTRDSIDRPRCGSPSRHPGSARTSRTSRTVAARDGDPDPAPLGSPCSADR